MNKLIAYIPNTDLRNGHDGLAKVAIKQKIDISVLGGGNMVAFVNRARTAVKIHAGGDMIGYLRLKKGHLDPRVIKYLPKHFSGSAFDYDKSVEAMINDQFPKWFKKKGEKS